MVLLLVCLCLWLNNFAASTVLPGFNQIFSSETSFSPRHLFPLLLISRTFWILFYRGLDVEHSMAFFEVLGDVMCWRQKTFGKGLSFVRMLHESVQSLLLTKF